MPRLVELTEHPNPDVRCQSLEVLAEIKDEASIRIIESARLVSLASNEGREPHHCF
jgi:hypothetical protein